MGEEINLVNAEALAEDTVSSEHDAGAPSPSPDLTRYIARQPILGRNSKTFGYELLFRSGKENAFQSSDGEQASRVVIDNVFLLGLRTLTDSRVAFLNLTRETILSGTAALLPKERVVLEVLETVEADESVIEAVKELKEAGYKIALDDFTAPQDHHPLIEMADFIKVDFPLSTVEEREAFARRFVPQGIHLLAEKVETQDEFEFAVAAGYEYCQGYFFARPKLITGRDVPAFKLNLIRILQEANGPDFDQDRLEQILRHEPAVCYRLLKYLNTVTFAFRSEITSIHHALTLLGEQRTRKWLSLVAATAMGQDKPSELMVTGLVRARCSELLAEAAGVPDWDTDLFLAGVLSIMDAILGKPLPSILEELKVSSRISSALTHETGRIHLTLNAVMSMETGDWEKIDTAASAAGVSSEDLESAYIQSIEWAHAIFRIN
jgi:c-di-GMP-related signal transduction protein